MVDTNDLNQEQVDSVAQQSVEIIALAIGLAYKWQKKDLIDRMQNWIQDFTKSMTVEEKEEFSGILKKVGVVE
jgi:hypothetical protein